jgi:hypothetical protein
MTDPMHNAHLGDERLPAVEILLGAGIPEPLRAAVGASGADVVSASTRQVTWWPGRSITVRYRTKLVGPQLSGNHDLIATAGTAIPEGALVVESAGTRIGMWRMPHDPGIPGLAAALDPVRAGALLSDLGAEEGPVETRLRAYRPGSRAVVDVRGRTSRVFLKLVPTGQVEALHRKHQALAAHLPVPHSLGFDPDLGVVALQALPGATLRDALDDPATALPDAASLNGLIAAFPEPAPGLKARSPIQRARRLAELLTHLLPESSTRIGELVDEIGTDPLEANVPSHGDFYEAQLLVADGAVVGLLDIDTFGWGRGADDPATMLGHLDVRRSSTRHVRRVEDYAGGLLRIWDRMVDPTDLRRRVAAVVLGLATGPFRVQRDNWPSGTMQRIEMAERWVRSARLVQDKALSDTSARSHARSGR